MKIILVFVFIFLIFYFLWQIAKHLIFKKIFKTFNQFNQGNSTYGEESKANPQKKNREFKKNIKWDAETIDFEEIPNKK